MKKNHPLTLHTFARSAALGLALAASFLPLGHAQEAQGQPVEVEQKPLPPLPTSISQTESVKTRISAWVNKHPDGLALGEGTLKDGRSYYMATGTAAIAVLPSDPRWVSARTNALTKALLQAKGSCARFQESRVTSEIETEFSQPSSERSRLEAERMRRQGLAAEGALRVAQALNSRAKASDSPALQSAALYAEKIVTNRFSDALTQRGLDPSKPIDQQSLKAVLSTESFKQSVRVTARARCTGVKVLAAFEQTPAKDRGEVGVVTIWTERLHQIADAIASGDYALVPPGTPGLPIAQQVQLDTRTLLTTIGPMVVRDPAGQYVVLAFAQAQPRSTNPQDKQGAYRVARTLADAMINQFVGESVALTEDLKGKDESKSFGDLDGAYTNDDSYYQRIVARAEKLSIRGIQEAHSWETLHPANNGPVVGVVVQWKPSAAAAAGRMGTMNENSGAIRQNAGAGAAPAARATTPGGMAGGPSGGAAGTPATDPARPAQPRTTNPYSGQGATSRDF